MATEKQIRALINMGTALGLKPAEINTDLSIQDASKEISKLSAIIANNIAISGYANPSRHFQMTDEEDADFGSAMGIDW